MFLDQDTLSSDWLQSELAWALERERELERTFVLPILLEDTSAVQLPLELANRLHLRLADFSQASVESLAERATLALFQLVAESFSTLQLEVPKRESLKEIQDQLSAGQARLLGIVAQKCGKGGEVSQREVEHEMGQPHASAELFYRLESLITQGFLAKRRITSDGQFSYRLSDDFST